MYFFEFVPRKTLKLFAKVFSNLFFLVVIFLFQNLSFSDLETLFQLTFMLFCLEKEKQSGHGQEKEQRDQNGDHQQDDVCYKCIFFLFE